MDLGPGELKYRERFTGGAIASVWRLFPAGQRPSQTGVIINAGQGFAQSPSADDQRAIIALGRNRLDRVKQQVGSVITVRVEAAGGTRLVYFLSPGAQEFIIRLARDVRSGHIDADRRLARGLGEVGREGGVRCHHDCVFQPGRVRPLLGD